MTGPKCPQCGRFISWAEAELERRYRSAPHFNCDDVQVGLCRRCRGKHVPMRVDDPARAEAVDDTLERSWATHLMEAGMAEARHTPGSVPFNSIEGDGCPQCDWETHPSLGKMLVKLCALHQQIEELQVSHALDRYAYRSQLRMLDATFAALEAARAYISIQAGHDPDAFAYLAKIDAALAQARDLGRTG